MRDSVPPNQTMITACSRGSLCAALIGLCMAAQGCGAGTSRPPTAAVQGRVTLDGKPVDQALITFIPTGTANGPNAVGLIELGEYALEPENGPVIGSMRVEIREAPAEDEPPPGETSKGFQTRGVPIPAQFNAQSKLTAEIEAGQTNEVNLILTTGH